MNQDREQNELQLFQTIIFTDRNYVAFIESNKSTVMIFLIFSTKFVFLFKTTVVPKIYKYKYMFEERSPAQKHYV